MRYLIAIAAVLIELTLVAKPLGITTHAESAILMNADTGAILFEKDAHSKRYPASITKVATALFAIHVEGENLEKKIAAQQDAIASISEEEMRRSNYTRPAYWLVPGGSHIGIKKGEELTLNDLLYGMMLVSGNDAANVIAQDIGGTIPDFMSKLNEFLTKIGCKDTLFYNPHGLYHPKHQTTAYDMALIMKEALKYPTFCKIVSTERYMRPKTNKQDASPLLQTNKLIRKGKYHYAKAIGGKTGYLSMAGNTLVVAAKDQDRTLIAVLLNCKERNDLFLDAIKMFDAAFNQPKLQRVILKKGPQKYALTLSGAKKAIPTYLADDIFLEYYPAEEPKLKCLLYWTANQLPIQKDQQVGELHLMDDHGKLIRNIPLLAQEEAKSSWWQFW